MLDWLVSHSSSNVPSLSAATAGLTYPVSVGGATVTVAPSAEPSAL